MDNNFKAYVEGHDAYLDGKVLEDNPYQDSDALYECWKNGFIEMKEFTGDFD